MHARPSELASNGDPGEVRFADASPRPPPLASAPESPSTSPDWEHYRALREQWTHEDNLVNHRLMWLILSQGLLFTAYGTLSTAHLHWLVIGFPFFGIVVAGVIGISIFAALAATREIKQRFDATRLAELCSLTPSNRSGSRGKWAAQLLPFVFASLWLLAMAGAFGS